MRREVDLVQLRAFGSGLATPAHALDRRPSPSSASPAPIPTG